MGNMSPESPTGRVLVILRLAGQFLIVLLITLILLEVSARLVWWNKSTITLSGREITLLPIPLITEPQKRVLENWRQKDDTYIQFDPVLGWTIRPATTAELGGVTYTSNSIGVRSRREYQLAKPEGITRIAALGPSFTLGQEVQDSAAWPALMEEARPDLEVMNWGVGAYGTDQAFLRYKTQVLPYQPDIVLIGYEEDNLWRNANRYRPYYTRSTGIPLTKPVYTLNHDSLVLLENPFTRIDDLHYTLLNAPDRFVELTCPQDYFCQETLYRSQRLDLLMSFRFLRTLIFEMQNPGEASKTELTNNPEKQTLLLIELFIKEVLAQPATPVVILFPQQPTTLSNYEKGMLADYQKVIAPFQERLKLPVIDLAPALVQAKQDGRHQYQDFFVNEGGHYSELGNQVVAQTVLQQLCQANLINCQ